MKAIRVLATVLVVMAAFAALNATSSDAQAEFRGKVARSHGGGCTLPCCAPRICYGNSPRPCCCTELVTVMLDVCHPCTGCPIQVPVCVPCDCVATPPAACDQGTLFGAGRTVFTWCCGYKVVVRYKRCGDVTVFYR
ncbi:MAG: hypothetical protein MPJ50_12435 [Pirellulales bacterium]|nr:hypothetical protein [Pirellulales bacterium]